MADPSEPTDRAADAPSYIFDILSNTRRRIFLTLLDSHNQAPAIADMAKDIAKYEHEEPIGKITDETIRRIHISLYHCHIPKLEDADVITYDQDRNTVAFTERGERFYAHAQHLTNQLTQTEQEI